MKSGWRVSSRPSATMEALLRAAAGRLGTTPQALRRAAENGELLNSLRQKGQGPQLEQVLSDPQAARRLLESPQGQSLLRSLGLLGPKP